MLIIQSLLGVINNVLNIKKKIDISILPSQGFFYKDDFTIWIKRADLADITEYETNFQKDNLALILNKIRKIAEKNIVLSKNYKFDDIKSLDIIFIFLEIVRFTKGSSLRVNYFNETFKFSDVIEFSSETFNYFRLDDDIMDLYSDEDKNFNLGGYRFTLPSIGVENCLTNFLIKKSIYPEDVDYNNFSYNFIYFLGDRNYVSENEIENLIQIFNKELDESELEHINTLVQMFSQMQRYSLIKDGKVIEVNKLDLRNIWK